MYKIANHEKKIVKLQNVANNHCDFANKKALQFHKIFVKVKCCKFIIRKRTKNLRTDSVKCLSDISGLLLHTYFFIQTNDFNLKNVFNNVKMASRIKL